MKFKNNDTCKIWDQWDFRLKSYSLKVSILTFLKYSTTFMPFDQKNELHQNIGIIFISGEKNCVSAPLLQLISMTTHFQTQFSAWYSHCRAFNHNGEIVLNNSKYWKINFLEILGLPASHDKGWRSSVPTIKKRRK